METTIRPLILLLAFGAFPFVLFFLAKWLIRFFYMNDFELADKTFAILRPVNIVFQPVFAIGLILITVYFGRIQYGMDDPVMENLFWSFYFSWPLSCAIFSETKKSKWEWAVFWGSLVLIIPWLCVLCALAAE